MKITKGTKSCMRPWNWIYQQHRLWNGMVYERCLSKSLFQRTLLKSVQTSQNTNTIYNRTKRSHNTCKQRHLTNKCKIEKSWLSTKAIRKRTCHTCNTNELSRLYLQWTSKVQDKNGRSRVDNMWERGKIDDTDQGKLVNRIGISVNIRGHTK